MNVLTFEFLRFVSPIKKVKFDLLFKTNLADLVLKQIRVPDSDDQVVRKHSYPIIFLIQFIRVFRNFSCSTVPAIPSTLIHYEMWYDFENI